MSKVRFSFILCYYPDLEEVTISQYRSEMGQVHEEQDILDWTQHLLLQHSTARTLGTSRRHPLSGKIMYFKRLGIDTLAHRFSVNSQELGQNIRDNYQVITPPNITLPPKELMREWLKEMEGKENADRNRAHSTNVDDDDYLMGEAEYDEVGEKIVPKKKVMKVPWQLRKKKYLLKACIHYLALEISSEVHLVQSIRQAYNSYALLNTTPTPDGMTVIDVFHPLKYVKAIRRKPLKQVRGEQFLEILKAESLGLIKTEIIVEEQDVHEHFLSELRRYYCVDKTSKLDQDWNNVRESVLVTALTKFLFPQFEVEARKRLKMDGFDDQSWKCLGFVESNLRTGRYLLDDAKQADRVRVLSVVPGVDQDATFAAILANDGSFVDSLKLNFLRGGGHSNEDRKRKENDIEALVNFIAQHRPDMCVVGADSMDSRRVFDDVKGVLEGDQLRQKVEEDGKTQNHLISSHLFQRSVLAPL